ncbi:MAG: hypothetical protein ACO22A_06955 [Schleiferiaceae bacterium]
MPSAMMEHDQNPQEGSAHEVPSQDLEATTLETATAETPAVTTADESVAAEESAQGIEFETHFAQGFPRLGHRSGSDRTRCADG